MDVFSGSFLGPTEGGYSCSGQQTGYERFHDGGGDLPVSHTRHHHDTLVARPGMLRTHGWRVRWTHTSHTLSSVWNHQYVHCWRSLFFCLPPVCLPVWTGWSPRLSQIRSQLQQHGLSSELKPPQVLLLICWQHLGSKTVNSPTPWDAEPHGTFWWSQSLDSQKYYYPKDKSFVVSLYCAEIALWLVTSYLASYLAFLFFDVWTCLNTEPRWPNRLPLWQSCQIASITEGCFFSGFDSKQNPILTFGFSVCDRSHTEFMRCLMSVSLTVTIEKIAAPWVLEIKSAAQDRAPLLCYFYFCPKPKACK